MKHQNSIDSHFRMRFIVSFLSFPWNGSDPVSISNCMKEKQKATIKSKRIGLNLSDIKAGSLHFYANLDIPSVPQMTTSQRCGCVPAD